MAPRAVTHTMPGPQPSPVLGWRGNLRAFGRDPLGYLSVMHRTYGAVAMLARGPHPVVCAFGPESTAHVLRDAALQPGTIGMLASALELPRQRYVEQLHAAAITTTQTLLDRWAVSQPIDIAFVMRQLMIESAVAGLLGVDQTQQPDLLALLQRAASDPLGTINVRGPLSIKHEQSDRLARRIVALLPSRIELDASYNKLADTQADVPAAPDDRRLEAVRSTVTIAALAASTATWTIFLLSQHPRILQDLHAQLTTLLLNQPPSFEQTQELPLLQRVLLESLRLLPPIGFGLHTSQAPLEINGYSIPEGTTLAYSPYVTHRLPERFIGPLRFRPERWLHIEPDPAEFLPFGRASYDQAVAPLVLLQAKTVLATLLQRYHLAFGPGAGIDRSNTLPLMPRAGLPMIITPPNRGIVRRDVRGNIREMVTLM